MRLRRGILKHRVIEIDLWRFIAAVAIMTHHLYTTGLDGMYYRLYDGNLFVEFFFLLTGYYMAKKFAKDAEFENKSFGEAFKVSIDYTFRKYKKLWGICALATCAQYSLLVLSDISLADKFKQVINFPMDILLLTELYQRPLVTPLWFLGAMFIALPFVATLMQIGNRLFQAFLSLVLIGTYYGFWLPVVIIPNNLVSTGGGEDILRSFICMYAGCFMYAVSEYIAKNEKIMFSKKVAFICGTNLHVSCFCSNLDWACYHDSHCIGFFGFDNFDEFSRRVSVKDSSYICLSW